jgi:hypothetical protein
LNRKEGRLAEPQPNLWRRRVMNCAVVIGIFFLFLILMGFILIPIFFRSDRMNASKEKDDEDEERRQIYGR